MLVVQNRNELLNRFRVLLNNGKELKLYHELKNSGTVTSPSFTGHQRIANIYRHLVKTIEKGKTKRKDDYAVFITALQDDARKRVSEAAGAFLEAVAIESLASQKDALETGFKRVYGHTATIVVPDSFWGITAQESIDAIGRFERDVERVVEKASTSDDFDAVSKQVSSDVTRRIGDEAFLSHSRIGRRVQEYAGCTSYVWRTMKDLRVVGNPNGLYPVGNADHGDHWERDGKVFSWSNPPFDGHPGEAYGCRCQAIPLMGLNNPEIR